MPDLLIDSRFIYIPDDVSNPKVILDKLKRTIPCVGNNFSRITKVVISGATDPTLAKALLPIGTDIGTRGFILIDNLGAGQVGIGVDPEIVCNITDGGGGKINLYKVNHGLGSSSRVTINGSTYSGYYNVDSIVDNDNFKVVKTYTINESDVPVYSYSLCEIDLADYELTFFRLNDGITNLYAVGFADDVVLEIIVIED